MGSFTTPFTMASGSPECPRERRRQLEAGAFHKASASAHARGGAGDGSAQSEGSSRETGGTRRGAILERGPTRQSGTQTTNPSESLRRTYMKRIVAVVALLFALSLMALAH